MEQIGRLAGAPAPRVHGARDRTRTDVISQPLAGFPHAFGVSDNRYIAGADLQYLPTAPALFWIVTLTPTTTS